MSGDHNMYQKSKSYLDDFECPRCGHCCAEREWVGLTEKEVKAIANKRNDYGLPMTGRMWVFVADLTDKLKEKNHG